MKISLCSDWEFVRDWNEGFLRGEGRGETVRLPHTSGEVPLHYALPEHYAFVCGYRKRLSIPAAAADRRVFLQFDGAGHIATVYLNGEEIVTHRCGYTSFRVEITGRIHPGGEDFLAVRVDASEDPSIPPFGHVIDYLTYGGLYREAWLDICGPTVIEDMFVTTPTLSRLRAEFTVSGDVSAYRVRVIGRGGEELATGEAREPKICLNVTGAKPWSPDDPALVTVLGEVLNSRGAVMDTFRCVTGFRTTEWKADGFYLNGKRFFLRGLNRHQSYPYVGYAAPEALQREDARILRRELGCNAVRTSHYPQSQYFIDECDRQGLLVFTEIPGWQHIGDKAWQDQAVENTREMVLQYRNHPSIVLWGVRINESRDNDELYARTNELARKLDPSRATSGVRYITKSSLLEDVYAYNDFSHEGDNPGCRPKKAVTPDMSKALLISECNGHMFPTKAMDPWEKRQEHALRHARVQDAAAKDGEHAGCFAWCMVDYPTHKDFGSGDRVCYHGVMDMFRNPKLAAAVYASQQEDEPVLEIGSLMEIGDYPASRLGEIWAFTNADEVALFKNGEYVTSFHPRRGSGLPHPPIQIDDTIGQLLEKKEGFSKKKADALRAGLLSAGKHGLDKMPLRDKARMAECALRWGMKYEDAYDLYGKYVGNWGGEAVIWRFDAIINGRTVKSVVRSMGSRLRLDVRCSHEALREHDTYDMAAIRVRVLDEHGTPAVYAQLPVTFSVKGPASIVGPETVTAEGGMCGTLIRSEGKAGDAVITISAPGTETAVLNLMVTVS